MREYIAVFRQRWRWLVTSSVLGLVVAAVVGWLTPPQYTSEATLYITAQLPASDPAVAYDGSLLAQAQVKSYVELMTDPRIGADASARLGGAVDAATITRSISASAPADTSLLRFSVTAASPEEAQRIAVAVSASLTDLIGQIERPTAVDTTQPTLFARMVRPASFDADPTSLPLGAILMVGALVGFLVGILGALARNALDTTVRSPAALAAAAGAPALGRVPERPSHGAGALGVEDADSPAPDAFRRLRTRLGFLGPSTEHRVLVVAGPGGGAPSVACDLAASVAATGSRVLLVDGDMRGREVTHVFALPDTEPGLSDVLAMAVDATTATVVAADGRVDVLPAGSDAALPTELLVSGHVTALLTLLRDKYELVVVSAPPIPDLTDAAVLAPGADGVVLVARAGHVAREDVERAVGLIEATGGRVLGAVLTDTTRPTPVALRRMRSWSRPATTASGGTPNSVVRAPAGSPGETSTGLTPEGAPTSADVAAGGGIQAELDGDTSSNGESTAGPSATRNEYVAVTITPARATQEHPTADDGVSEPGPSSRARPGINGRRPANDG